MTDPLSHAVEQAMRDAARLAIMPRFRTTDARVLVNKADTVGGGTDSAAEEPVTAADRESEELLSNRLAALIPGAGIVGEEAAHADPALLQRLRRGTCWLIDPLDGTANFAAGKGPFGVLVALVEDGLPVGGWIFDPLSGRFCAARAGHGASINGERFTVTDPRRDCPLVAVTRLFRDQTMRANLMEALAPDHGVVDSPRCAADQYPRIATGGNDVTLFTRTLPWDHAAGITFLNAAGGRAARPNGTAYRCDENSEGLIAATSQQQWDAMARRLDELGYDLTKANVTL
ncbi:inositol monophosphatase family protein [Novosphingobium sp. BL-8H]|uniref:inositol monophosphatase family protein n=1 Tax=Novosphingobium sp. BL-8H TaxID=3127640 RepID=UPI0037572CE2